MPSRGDRKPCSQSPCAGTMQFGREPMPRTSSGLVAYGERGWVCSDDAAHFLLASSGSDPVAGAGGMAWIAASGPADVPGRSNR